MTTSDPIVEFFLFKRFISSEVLIIFYFLGSIVLPLFALKVAFYMMKRFHIFGQAYESFSKNIWQKLTFRQKVYFSSAFLAMFLFFEILWRMMFEFLIAYMQIRDALVG